MAPVSETFEENFVIVILLLDEFDTLMIGTFHNAN